MLRQFVCIGQQRNITDIYLLLTFLERVDFTIELLILLLIAQQQIVYQIPLFLLVVG